jgi:cystathionine beta-lyase/cystathionine gamma-synthase
VKKTLMQVIDLRSDTVTKPTLKMRQAMKEAEVGDDGFGEDPMTNRFEKMAAEKVGKEDALFVSSGVMGNLIAIMVHTKPGDGLICDRKAHINTMASGNTAALTGVTICPLSVKVSCKRFVEDISGKGVYVVYFESDYGRMVTHKDLNKSDIDYALEVIKSAVSEWQRVVASGSEC